MSKKMKLYAILQYNTINYHCNNKYTPINIHKHLHRAPIIVTDAELSLGLLDQPLTVDQGHDDGVALQLRLAEHIHEEVLHCAQRGNLWCIEIYVDRDRV